MKILVFGATGKLGCYSSLDLKRHGHEVIAVGRRHSDNGFFADYGIEFIGDFDVCDKKMFEKLPTRIDGVVNMAGAMPAHSGIDPNQYVNSIVNGTVNILEWMRVGDCRRIIFNTTPSDVCAYFGKPIPVDDDALRSFPKDGGDHAVYAICKNAAVDILEHYKVAYGFKPCVFRHLTVYGWSYGKPFVLNGQVKKSAMWVLYERCIKGEEIEVWGDPTVKKELLYIDDFTEAICKAIEHKEACGIFNLPGDRPYTLEEQIDGIISAYCPQNSQIKKVYCPSKPSSPQNLLCGEKAYSALGWKAQISWPEACKRTAIAARNNIFEKIWGKPPLAIIPQE